MVTKINSRAAFKDYCLRKLGAPVLDINVDDDQINDRVDEALNMFWDFHYDARELIYYSHQVTLEDFNNKFIYMPPNVIGVTKILPVSSAFNVGSVFSLQYQIVLQDMWRWSSVQLTHYFQIYQYTQLIEQLLVGQQPIRFNEMNGRLYIDMNWTRVPVGQYIVVQGYRRLDPDQISLMLDAPGNWLEGETVTASNGATGKIYAENIQARQELFIKDFSTTPFVPETTIVAGTSGSTATIKYVANSLDVWNNRWLQNYATALIKRQWAQNISKYNNVVLPGGMTLNSMGILREAQEEIAASENVVYTTYNMPAPMMVG